MPELIKYEAAKRALADCVDVDEVKGLRNKATAVTAYAKQAGDRELELTARAVRFRAERRLGQLITGMPKARGAAETRGKKNPALTLEDIGVDKNLAKAARKAAKPSEEEFEQFMVEHLASGQVPSFAKARNGAHVSKNGRDNNEWYTPVEYIEAARKIMGGIDLDPCSSEVAQANVRAEAYFDIDDDGLEHEWYGRIWMNPPYGADLIGKFCAALLEEMEAGNATQACVLVNNATDTEWCQSLLSSASVVCFLRGRVTFLDATGKPANKPLQGQALFYFGPRIQSAMKTLTPLGACFQA
jgi:hypothetical protein